MLTKERIASTIRINVTPFQSSRVSRASSGWRRLLRDIYVNGANVAPSGAKRRLQELLNNAATIDTLRNFLRQSPHAYRIVVPPAVSTTEAHNVRLAAKPDFDALRSESDTGQSPELAECVVTVTPPLL